MATQKFDGVIEAAHFKNGQILYVRAFERRGFTFSDCVLIDRKDLIERLKQGKKYLTGHRKEFMSSTFELGKRVQVIGSDGHEVIATRAGGANDELEGVPFI